MTDLRDRFIGDLRLRGLAERTVEAFVSAVLGLGQARSPALPPARLPPPAPLPYPPRARVQELPDSTLSSPLPSGAPAGSPTSRTSAPASTLSATSAGTAPRRHLQPLHRGVRRLDRHLPLVRLPLRSPESLLPPGRPLHRPLPPARPPLRLRQGPRLRPARTGLPSPPRGRAPAPRRSSQRARRPGGPATRQDRPGGSQPETVPPLSALQARPDGARRGDPPPEAAAMSRSLPRRLPLPIADRPCGPLRGVLRRERMPSELAKRSSPWLARRSLQPRSPASSFAHRAAKVASRARNSTQKLFKTQGRNPS